MKHALAFFLCACTEVTRLSLPAPPTADEILGAYSVSWSGGVLLGAGVIAGSDILGFAPWPCATAEELRGTYEYEPATGELVAELKPLEGSAKLTLGVRFENADVARGEYVVLLLGSQCSTGALELRRRQ